MKFRTFLLTACLLGWVSGEFLQAQELRKENGRYVTELVNTFSLASGGALEIGNLSGNIRVSGWDRDEVKVSDKLRLNVFTEPEAREILERIQNGYRVSGERLEISAGGGDNWIDRSIDVQVPQQFDVSIRSYNSNISLSQVEGTISLSTSNGNIDLENLAGDITVSTSAGNLRFENIRAPVSGKTSGGNIWLKNVAEPVDLHTSGGNIDVREAQKAIRLRTSGGQIVLRDIQGEVIAHTSGGQISALNCARETELHTSGGDVEARNIGGRLDARTSGGDVLVNQARGEVLAETSGGDIELRDIAGAVRAATSAGDIEADITGKDFSREHRIYLHTSSGNIRLTLPEKLPAAITAEIHDTGRWNRYQIYSDFPLSQEARDERRILRSSGEINGGGMEILLETSHGDIHIRKQRP